MTIALAYITCPTRQVAESISRAMIEQGHAACTNIFPISSIYLWQKKIESEDEHVAILKTTQEKWEDLSKAIELAHPYEVPCIMRFDVCANDAYEEWIRVSVH